MYHQVRRGRWCVKRSPYTCRCTHLPLPDLEIERVSDTDSVRTYVFDLKLKYNRTSLRNAVVFARQQLLEEVAKKNYNLFLQEGYVHPILSCLLHLLRHLPHSWTLTVYRRDKSYRIEVQYIARSARVQGQLPAPRLPPYMALLQNPRTA